MIERSYRVDRLAIGAVTALLVVLLLDGLVGVPLVRPALAFLVVGLVPGALALQVAGVVPEFRARWLVYAVGVGLLLVMLVWMVAALLLSALGVARPLDAWPMFAGLALLVGVLAAASRGRDYFFEDERRLSVRIPALGPTPLALALLPLLAVLSTLLLNRTGTNLPLVAVLVAVAVVPLLVALGRLDDRHLPLALYAMALALVYHKSLWRAYVYSGHGVTVAISKQGRWAPGLESVLPNGVLSPGLASVAGVEILTQLKVLNPAIVALIPVAVYVSFRHFTAPRRAFLGASLFAFAHPFYFQYPPLGRAAMPVLYLALLGAVIGDTALPSLARKLLAVLFGVGIVVSHYGTSYYVMFGVVGALGLLVCFEFVDAFLSVGAPTDRLLGDGGVTTGGFTRRLDVVSPRFGQFYVVAVIAWYLYTGGGRRFDALTEHIASAYQSLIAGGSTGSTAVRLATNYNATSIRLSKFIYLALGGLMGLGLLRAYWARFRRQEPLVDDEYLALASMLLLLFGGTFVVSGAWGGGRPMMVVLSVTGLFAVLGAETGWSLCSAAADRLGRGTTLLERAETLSPAGGGSAGLAALLACFLVLNSGVAAATAVGGYAPSNVPVQPRFDEAQSPDIQSLLYVESDLRTHAWLVEHRDRSLQIYGDRIVRGQATDKYVGEIAARTQRPVYRFPKQNHPDALEQSGVEEGYLLLLGHNVEHDIVSIGFVSAAPLATYQMDRPARDRIYVGDHSVVYHHANATNTSRREAVVPAGG